MSEHHHTSSWLIPLLVIAATSIAIWQINQTEPPIRHARPAAPLPLVEPLPSEPGPQPLTTQAYGTVIAAETLAIRPQVGGIIQSMNPSFEPGGIIPANQPLFHIDTTDYQLAIDTAMADIEAARAELAIEAGKRKVASEELRQLEGSVRIDAKSRSLALRTPQLHKARAELERANKQLEKAQLALARTQQSAPHDLVVISRSHVAGELINAGDSIGEVVRANRFWVSLQVAPEALQRLRARTQDKPGSTVTVVANGQHYPAEVTRIRAVLNAQTRLAEVLAEVTDPLGRLTEHAGRPPLLLGTYVQAHINSGQLDNAVSLPRQALQADNRLWLVDAQKRLRIRQIKPLYIGPDRVFIAPLAKGERILSGNPGGLPPGTEVRLP